MRARLVTFDEDDFANAVREFALRLGYEVARCNRTTFVEELRTPTDLLVVMTHSSSSSAALQSSPTRDADSVLTEDLGPLNCGTLVVLSCYQSQRRPSWTAHVDDATVVATTRTLLDTDGIYPLLPELLAGGPTREAFTAAWTSATGRAKTTLKPERWLIETADSRVS